MLSEERYEKILELIRVRGFVKASELTESFDVSAETVRRDLFFLESRGLLKRIHGGAAAAERAREFQDLSHRVHMQSEQKRRLAHTAASMLRERDVIAVDSGSTAIEFAEALRDRLHELTVVTHSLSVFQILRECAGYRLILIGGQFLPTEDAFYGALAQAQLANLRVRRAFVFPSGISLKYGVTDYIAELIPIQKTYLEIAEQAVILADSSKFETTALVKICGVGGGPVLVTDDGLDDEVYARYLRASVAVYRGEAPRA